MATLEDVLLMDYQYGGDNALAGTAPAPEPSKKFIIAGQEYYTTPSIFQGSYAGERYNMPLLTPQMIGERLGRQVSPRFFSEPVSREITSELVDKAYRVAEHAGFASGGLLAKAKGLKAQSWKAASINKSVGIFDPKNPPRPDGDRPISALLLDDGTILYDTNAMIHADMLESAGINPARIVDGGFIVNGKYVQGSADAARIGRQAKAKEAITENRLKRMGNN